MSSAKHRNKHGSVDRSSHADDVAKKNPKGGISQTGGVGLVGPLCTGIFYLLVVSALAVSGWYLQTLSDQVQAIGDKNRELSLQNQELNENVEGVLQQVNKLKTTVGVFESSLKEAQKEVDRTNLAVRKGENEVSRIGEGLQKLQNEILQDLSDGIKDVKAARERDFTSLENTVEERLTELTKSINDNIAVFTEVQKKSQLEIDDLKSKVSSLEEVSLLKSELKAIAGEIKDLRASSAYKDGAIASLKSTVDSLESAAQDRDQELTSFVQEYDNFKQSVKSEHTALENLREAISKVQTSTELVSREVSSLKEDLQHAKSDSSEQERLLAETNDLLETVEKSSESFESRLRLMDEKTESLNSATAQQSDKIVSVLLKQEVLETVLASLEKAIDAMKSSPGEEDLNFSSLQGTLQSLTKSHESILDDITMLKSDLGELQNVPSVNDIIKLQDKVQALADFQKQQMAEIQSSFDERLERLARLTESGISTQEGDFEKLPYIESSVGELRSSVTQVQSDMQMLRTAVDSLVAYSVKIENNEKNLESTKLGLEELRHELDRMLEKIEHIQENV